MRLPSFALPLAVTLGSLAAAAPAQAAQTFGSTLQSDAVVDNGCEIGTCTRMLFTLGGQEVRSPIDGVVVRWRAVGMGTVRLRIVHREGDVWSAGSASEPSAFPAGSDSGTWATRLPIRAGDFLAVDGDRASQAFLAFSDSRAWYWFPALQDGQVRPPRFFQQSLEVLVNADVEPDADGDGYGDETQDCAPGDTAVHEGCGAGTGGGTDPGTGGGDPGGGGPVGGGDTVGGDPVGGGNPAGTGDPAGTGNPAGGTGDPAGGGDPGAGSETGATGAVAGATAARCRVPRLRGLTLPKARAILRARGCRLAAVRRVKARAARRGRVLAQTPGAGRRAAAVRLRVGR